jgi:serine protease Do
MVMRLTASVCACAVLIIGVVAAQQLKPLVTMKFGDRATIVVTPDSWIDLLSLPPERWQPAVSRQPRSRGGPQIYERVAPAVVVVRTETGHGTGFFVSDDGLLITNNHVVAGGLSHDANRRASFANIHIGQLNADGTMRLRPEAARAYLYRTDATRDLALLKLDDKERGSNPVPYLVLSAVAPRPGLACAIIGHPSSGMLWTLRPGEVSAVGQMPADLVNLVMVRLAASPSDRAQIAEQLQALPSRRIILTTAGANPGDSGGPVVDDDGRVIAVTFSEPANPAEAKFTYHIHVDELRAFLAEVPTSPRYLTPDPWTLGPRVDLRDLDNDGKPDVLVAGAESPRTLLFDLGNDSPPASVRELVTKRLWRFEVGIHQEGGETDVFYDTDNDGQVDLILIGSAGDQDARGRFVRSAAGAWQYDSPKNISLLSGSYLTDKALGARFDRFAKIVLSR